MMYNLIRTFLTYLLIGMLIPMLFVLIGDIKPFETIIGIFAFLFGYIWFSAYPVLQIVLCLFWITILFFAYTNKKETLIKASAILTGLLLPLLILSFFELYGYQE